MIQASVFSIPKSKIMIYTGAKLGSSQIRNIYLRNVNYEHFVSDETDYEKYEDYIKVFLYRNPMDRFLSGQVQDLRGYFEGVEFHEDIFKNRPDLVDDLYRIYTEEKDEVIYNHHSIIDLHERIHVLNRFKDLNKVHFINLKQDWSNYLEWFLSKQIENFDWDREKPINHKYEVNTLKTLLIHDERFKKIDFMDNIFTEKYIEDMKKSMEVFSYIETHNKNRFITKRVTKISRKSIFFKELFSI
jgi:hypothetical protein